MVLVTALMLLDFFAQIVLLFVKKTFMSPTLYMMKVEVINERSSITTFMGLNMLRV